MRRVMFIASEYLLWRLYLGEALLIMVGHKGRLVLECVFSYNHVLDFLFAVEI